MTLISREDAIEVVAKQWLFEASAESPYVNDDDIGEYRNLAEGLFEDVPTVKAEPIKHGEWVWLEIKGIINPLTGKNRTYIGCSCCGEPIPTDSIIDCIEEEDVNFCFGCGAKMDKD